MGEKCEKYSKSSVSADGAAFLQPNEPKMMMTTKLNAIQNRLDQNMAVSSYPKPPKNSRGETLRQSL